jgi:nitroreductase
MPLLTPADAVNQLQWRYATKKFDPQQKITAENWHALEQSLVLSPSSFGLQPWRFLVVTDSALRAQLLPASWNQKQIVEASHLVVFARKVGLTEADVDAYAESIVSIRQVPPDSLAGMKKMIIGFMGQPNFDAAGWAENQVYLALGVFLTTAAMLGIDACPIEGFMPAKYDEILPLKSEGYASVVVAAAGYRAADDKYAALPKVRYPVADMVRHL